MSSGVDPKRNLRIGTSGWSYDHWRGCFYPEALPTGERLAFYARSFDTVEIDSTFYRLPGVATLRHWHDEVPSDFLFSVKANRYLTHMKKLKDPEPAVQPFFDRIEVLRGKLGPVLFQLPPRWCCNSDRLAGFLDALPEENRYAFEFRDHSWLNDHILRLLEARGVAFCIYDLAGFKTPLYVTTDFVYVRLHGPAVAYSGRYDDAVLARWAENIVGWLLQGRDVFCYFDNDEAGHAVGDARRLVALVAKTETAGWGG